MDKSVLVEKIASSIGIDISKECSDDKKLQALKLAAEMLKVAAEKQRELEFKNAQLYRENNELKQSKESEAKRLRAENIANLMFENEMIKRSEIESKINELSNMDAESLAVIENTVNSIPKKAEEEYVSSLTFLCGDNNIVEKDTLSRAIGKFIKN